MESHVGLNLCWMLNTNSDFFLINTKVDSVVSDSQPRPRVHHHDISRRVKRTTGSDLAKRLEKSKKRGHFFKLVLCNLYIMKMRERVKRCFFFPTIIVSLGLYVCKVYTVIKLFWGYHLFFFNIFKSFF